MRNNFSKCYSTPVKQIVLRKKLENRDQKLLAPYAILSSKTAGREFPEPEEPTRTVFQRDRDRIIHSKAFRRLSGKTQVFIATYGDHFRDRLSHTLEVAQVARDMARSLALNEDLAEAIALSHDLGHTPFGHAGEQTLNEIMNRFGFHFEHNEQSKRVVEKLEKQFPHFDGLNLSFEVRQGLAKHQTLYDQRTKKITGKTLEAQVVDIADEIAYHNHDLDDGLRAKLFEMAGLVKLPLLKEAKTAAEKKHGPLKNPIVLRSRVISMLISLMITDVLKTTRANIKRSKVRNLADVLKHKKNLISFSPSFQKKVQQLREFLWDRMYQSRKVLYYSHRGQRILKKLFGLFYKRPRLMPRHFYERIEVQNPLAIVVKDYVAGLTDMYATELARKYL